MWTQICVLTNSVLLPPLDLVFSNFLIYKNYTLDNFDDILYISIHLQILQNLLLASLAGGFYEIQVVKIQCGHSPIELVKKSVTT
jgi:hypothetical protein